MWTIFRAEIAHFKTQHVAYRKTGAEWEILGELGMRLHHREEAKECFQRSLDSSRCVLFSIYQALIPLRATVLSPILRVVKRKA